MKQDAIVISPDFFELKAFENQLIAENEKAMAHINQIKSKTKYSKCDRQTICKLQKLVDSNNLLLTQAKLMIGFKVGMWVQHKKSLDKQPGLIESLRIINRVLEIQVKWGQATVSVPETPINLESVPSELMQYVWNGEEKAPKLIRRIDGFECDDVAILQQELDKLPETERKQKVYLSKRIGLFIEPLKGNQLNIPNILKPRNQHKPKQVEALLKFAERKPQTQSLPLDLIRKDGGTQQRVKLNPETVTEYAEAMEAGDKFPPVKVMYDGENYWLYDGFHTTEACWINKVSQIDAIVTEGTKRDAILKSVSVNSDHGLRRTNADKRKAVVTLLEDEEWSKWSNCEIAKHCKVSEGLVRKIKKDSTFGHFVQYEVRNSDNDLDVTNNVISDTTKTYKDKHGNTTTMNTSNIGKSQKDSTNEVNESNPSQISKQHPVKESEEYNGSKEVAESNLGQIKIMRNTLVQLKLSSFDGVSEKLKLLNHSYGIVIDPTEIGNAYNVKFFGQQLATTSSYVCKVEDLEIPKEVSINLLLSPQEFLEKLYTFGSVSAYRSALAEFSGGKIDEPRTI